MDARIFGWISRVLTLLALISALAPAPVAAANDTPDGAIQLTAAMSSVSDSLVGRTGGAYRYYQVAYQGGSAPVTFTLTFQPGYGSTGNRAFGFNLYGPNGLALAGQSQGTSNSVSTAQFTFASPASLTILVQVYNYTNGMQVGYTLAAAGLSGGSSTGIVATNNATPDQAVPVSTINATIGGTITGSSAGAFQYYTLNYPGGQSPLVISMNVTPTYTGQGQAYGFNVYRSNVNGGSSLVAHGSVTASDVNSTTLSATITGRSASQYQLQVVNYWPGVSISYGVNTTGLAGPAPARSGNTDAGHAVVLNSATPGATETLNGNPGGAFDYFLVSYPGNNSPFYLSATYASLGGAPDNTQGFNVYNGSSLVATVNPNDDGSGVHSASWTYQNATATTFGIQVFNYSQGTTTGYTLYQVGAQ